MHLLNILLQLLYFPFGSSLYFLLPWWDFQLICWGLLLLKNSFPRVFKIAHRIIFIIAALNSSKFSVISVLTFIDCLFSLVWDILRSWYKWLKPGHFHIVSWDYESYLNFLFLLVFSDTALTEEGWRDTTSLLMGRGGNSNSPCVLH